MVPTFLFDGDCAFCLMCARFIARWIPTTARVMPWQFADLAALGVTRAEALEAVQWVDGSERLSGPVAIAALLRHSNAFWRPLGWILGAPRSIALAWPVYRWIARNRHRLPGGTPACAISPRR